jgi:Rrf2 family transcriptional regulator, iron-sulfur cluster assembly transcription factor
MEYKMKLMTKGWVAVPAMVDLAMHHDTGPVTLAEISERQKVSLSYLEQLFCKLRRNALVRSVHGPGGGYHLAKDVAQVSVADIIVAVDDRKEGEAQNGRDGEYCVTPQFWSRLDEQIFDYLGTVTLKQLVEEHKAKESDAAAVRVPGPWVTTPEHSRTAPSA